MSSSSDIEKLFDHFGGDANAYQEIGRENEARSARTRWPLLVTLDLTQPAIPAIGQAREAKPQAPVSAAPTAVDRQDTAPRDVAAVTRAKAPLFTRSHRRDIPPVAVAAAAPAAPSGASRFGAPEAETESTVWDASGGGRTAAAQHAASAPIAPVASAASAAFAPATPVTPIVSAPVAPVPHSAAFAPVAAVPAVPLAAAAAPVAGASPAFPFPFRTPVTQTPSAAPAAAPLWAQAPARAVASTPAFAPTPAFAATYAPATPAAQPAPPASILGKLFAADPQPAPPQPAAPANESAPLQSVFDRLRGAPAPTPATPADASRAAAPGIAHSWLVNGPRRS
jgi:hypothetical protein